MDYMEASYRQDNTTVEFVGPLVGQCFQEAVGKTIQVFEASQRSKFYGHAKEFYNGIQSDWEPAFRVLLDLFMGIPMPLSLMEGLKAVPILSNCNQQVEPIQGKWGSVLLIQDANSNGENAEVETQLKYMAAFRQVFVVLSVSLEVMQKVP
ncbi:hypothetical protein BCR41DRAFT_398280 [Lobosporangium transversale]|uniref:Uncharacterized protein n=1 Tax=Lobosporangium transversale TaxID=64571 RepID=A0A1Y2GGY4_9FUNG|nr:hypothetical protein BCR41DRAFT_398280 [Lobosporangium transversale]ORZ10634.1 hypothetical protein BCR41DRAFT_398280 [Lobosporangium transversale]|eukprot:XP_021879355.1 hypothetical protein BCR41DRAFT_398280 [Lobosporangium transversale]